MNTAIHNAPVAVAANPVLRVTQQMIADKVGVSNTYVNRILNGQCTGNEELQNQVKKIAKELGYTKPSERKEQKKNEKELRYLQSRNFPSQEAETQRMVALRAQGYSNKEIASKIGKCIMTVRRRIGAQDPDMSKINRALGAKHRSQRNTERCLYTAAHIIKVYNEAAARLIEIKDEQVRLEAKISELKPKVDKAVKIAEQYKRADASLSNTALINAAPTSLQ